ncbi:MAG: AI-2E family transporter [Bacteroidetes bacterium]|nr:AI-2E family transporter [Bacteroidota bacterium]
MNNQISHDSVYDTTIRLFILGLIIAWCLMLMYPFISIILWSMILALALYPLHRRLSKFMGGRPKWASVIIICAILVIIILPTWFLIGALIDEVKALKVSYDAGTLTIPPPTEKVKTWPIIGEKLYDFWANASANIEQLIVKHKDQLIDIGKKVGSGILSAASGVVQIMLSLFIAGVLLSIGGTGENIRKFFRKVSGDRGDDFADLILKTVGSVVKGILGESLVMALLNGTVFLLAGIPFAGIWTLLAFVFAVLQLPVFFVTIPVIIYMFAVKAVLPAILWTVALLVVALSDNVLTPLMLGKGAPVPMVVIFVGVIGGFIFSGFIGLFTGAIVMSLGYTLFVNWINAGNHIEKPDGPSTLT